MRSIPRLYAIADASFGDPVAFSELLFSGGVRLLQVRNKKASARDFLQQVESILRMAPRDASIVVNDRIDIAKISKAAGVHLGQQDLPATVARGILGSSPIVGVSTHSMEQALEADNHPVDYIAVGPIFPTASKVNPAPVIGLQMLERICRIVQKPVVAIGGDEGAARARGRGFGRGQREDEGRV